MGVGVKVLFSIFLVYLACIYFLVCLLSDNKDFNKYQVQQQSLLFLTKVCTISLPKFFKVIYLSCHLSGLSSLIRDENGHYA